VLVVAWESVDSSKATEKQIKYAEKLLEQYYGDINEPIYTMSKQNITALITDLEKKIESDRQKFPQLYNKTSDWYRGRR
jgi:hypothetical protein